MEWIPQNTDFLTVFGAILGAGSAALGLIVALNQYSSAARARRTMDWTSTALGVEKDPGRQIVLTRLKHRAQAHLIAVEYVSWWRFSETIAWTLLTPGFVIVGLSRDGNVSSIIAVMGLGVALMTLVFRRAIRLYLERTRVSHQYEVGGADVEPVRIGFMNQMEGGTRLEFALALVCATVVVGTASLLSWSLTEERPSASWAWVYLGVFFCWSSFQVVRSYVRGWARKAVSSRY